MRHYMGGVEHRFVGGEVLTIGPELLQKTTDKVKLIQDRMRVTQSRQKSYADKRRRPLQFEEGDHVFLSVTPTTVFGRAIKSTKLTPKLIGPYQINKRIRHVAYEIALPPHQANLHNVFSCVPITEIHCGSHSCTKGR